MNPSSSSMQRSRAGSVLTSRNESGVSDNSHESADLCRGPGTPDFTLDRYGNIRGKRENKTVGKSNLRTSNNLGDDEQQNDDGEDERKKDAAKRIPYPPYPPRPKLTNQIRSFLSSFTGESSNNTTIVVPKALSSHQIDQLGGSSSAHMFQGLSASAQELQAENDNAKPNRIRPKSLAMPSARQAGPDGLQNLNDDSPPLTPSGSEERDGSNSERQYDYDQNDRFSIWSPFSSNTMTASSSSSGRTSPVSSQSNHVQNQIGNHTRSSSLRVVTGTPYMKTAKVTLGGGLLPSHMISPPSSPDSQHTMNGRRQRETIFDGAERQAKLLDLNVLEGLSSLSSIALSRFQSFFFSAKMPPLRQHVPALFFLLTAFVGSTICILLALSTLPLRLPNHITDLTLTEIRDMSLSLREYSRSSNRAFAHTLLVLGTFFTWKQSFTVPGSIIMNVVFGAMYGTFMGTLFTSLLTAVGGMFCYLLMAPLGPLIGAMPGLNNGLQKMRKALSGSLPAESHLNGGGQSSNGEAIASSSDPTSSHTRVRSAWLHSSTPTRKASKQVKSDQRTKKGKQNSSNTSNLWSYLLVLRLLPVVPYGLMNIACSVLRVPLLPYTVTLGLGSIPWNACTVQIGDLLAEVVSSVMPIASSTNIVNQLDSNGFSIAPSPSSPNAIGNNNVTTQSGLGAISEKIWNKEMMFKLVLMSLISLAPMVIQRWIKKRNELSMEEEGQEEMEEDNDVEGEDIERIMLQQHHQQQQQNYTPITSNGFSNEPREIYATK